MLEDLRSLVEFPHSGSIAIAADRPLRLPGKCKDWRLQSRARLQRPVQI